jgi:hypothetical protein
VLRYGGGELRFGVLLAAWRAECRALYVLEHEQHGESDVECAVHGGGGRIVAQRSSLAAQDGGELGVMQFDGGDPYLQRGELAVELKRGQGIAAHFGGRL